MGLRTIRTGIGSYQRVDGGWWFGMLGEEVDVHEDDLERFDRLNGSESDLASGASAPADSAEVPTSKWSVAQIDDYAGTRGIELTGAKNKGDKLALIEAALTAAATEATGTPVPEVKPVEVEAPDASWDDERITAFATQFEIELPEGGDQAANLAAIDAAIEQRTAALEAQQAE